jgi:hypothetical protein
MTDWFAWRANQRPTLSLACPALFAKIFWFSEDPNHFYIHRHPVPLRGALRNVTSAGRDAVDADGAPDEGA